MPCAYIDILNRESGPGWIWFRWDEYLQNNDEEFDPGSG